MAPRVKWQTSQDNYLIQHYHSKTALQIATHLGFTKSAVLRRARHLKIPKKTENSYKHKRYSHAEKAFIFDNINTLGTAKVAEHLKRSEESIRIFCKRRKISIKPEFTWEKKHIRFLKTNASFMDLEKLATHLEKTPQAVRKYANEHNITIKTKTKEKNRPWDSGDVSYLMRHINKPHHIIAKELGRTAEAVAKFASQNNIIKRGIGQEHA